jgi:hypothetical protein
MAGARFDEIELQPAIFEFVEETPEPAPIPAFVPATRVRRLLALLTDLSLFVALSLALSPLLPASTNWIAIAALGGFVLLLSFYYFVGCWLLWGKTIGGTIFDVKVMPIGAPAMAFRNASERWAGLMLSLASGGIGFALAALPSRMSLPDRMSATCCVSST